MSTQDILVFVETLQGSPTTISFELLGGARDLASSTGGEVIALLLGQDVERMAGSLAAADRVLIIEDPLLASFSPEPYLGVLKSVVRAENPRAVLIGSTTVGLDLAPALAWKMNAPCVMACQGFAADGECLTIVSRIYAGKMLSEVVVTKTPAVLAVLSGSFKECRDGGRGSIEKCPLPVALGPCAITFESMHFPEAGDIDISQEPFLISVGRGIQQQENIELAEELAKALDGVLCASRPVTDQGWLPPTRQVGKSGMTVKPKCYLALGVSGAPEHIEGMKDSELIIAVNTDPNAPIFDIADYGVVADVLELVPVLTETAKARVVK